MNKPLILRIFSSVGVIALAGAMALAQDAAPSSAPRSDGQIEMDVVHALDGSQALKNDLITAATIQSEVTLSGTVSSDSSKQLAESIAKTVPGVSKVHNNLKVGNPADDANAQGAPANDPSNGMADAQAAPPQDNGQNPNYNQNPGPDQGAPSINQAPPPNWGDQNQQQQPAYGQQQPPAYGQNQPGYGQQAPPPPGYGQAGPPPGYGQQAPPPGYGQRPDYAQAPPPPRYSLPRGPVTIPQGTLIQVRTNEPVNSKRAKDGEPIQFTVIQDVTFGGVLAIPRGATVHGVIAEVKRSEKGSLTGSNELALELTSLDLMGQSYPLQSDMFKVKGPGKGGRSAGNVVGGALIGAIIGGAIGGGEGAAVGAVAGGGTGAAASAASSGPGVWIPAEALVSFHLATPITVEPVSQQEAMRLAQGLNPGGPNLYRRGPYAYPYRPYPYAPVYYRPYYFTGGYYYWR
ncbi:BON domain-containing protein [Telmatobacter sp. DSM 110680]|uniref:BON domain-containing protein n=1 Tax=Telmatobacter sp. DSM 110680 TaxID=3036704 RepID=A0AAU7DP06_9BACT